MIETGIAQFLAIEDEAKAQSIWARKRIKFTAEITEINRKKATAIKARIAQFFHPITKHFSNKIEFIMDEIGEMPEMENLPKGNTKDFTSKIFSSSSIK